MNLFCFKAFLAIYAFVVTFALEKFVSPNLSCGLTCSGDLDAPYDNLLIALINTQTEEDVTIYLLNDPSAPHYILGKEYAQGSSSAFRYQLPVSSTLVLKKRIIQPVFCGEEPVLSNPSLASQCITRDKKLTIYVKTTEFTLNILQSMEISNIVFDASEDISVWNTDSDELRNCIYSRRRCCADPSTPSPTSIQCVISGDYSGLGLTPTTSLISLKSTDLSSTVSFISNNTDFNWFLSPNLVSLINTGSNPFSLEFDNGTINVIYFSKGFIYHDQNSATSTLSSISLTNMNFENYNLFDLILASTSRTEGFLFFAGSYYYGDLAIQNSQFVNITNSVRNGCSSLTNQYYNIPLDNTFVGVQVSKTDLWNLFHADHRGVQNSSSLIFLTTYDGTLSIASSNFSNIFGTSGSVLRVDDVTQSDTSFTITESLFDNNFAYDGFSNVRISKTSNGAFNKMLSCPKFEVTGSKFTNSYGCPGSYGNVLYLCYWDSAPPASGTLSSYAGAASLSTYWENNTQPEDAYVTVKSCIFEYNIMSVSTSLAVIGSPFSILEGNTFQMNGGTTAQIYLLRISNSYYYGRYPSTVNPNAPLVHFGQATAVYIDRFIRLQSNSNQYISNWGPWEGSLALGDSLTVKNWIRLADTLNFDLDSFSAHQGIPSDIRQFIPDLCLKNNCFMAPIITFSYDDKGTQSVYTQLRASSLTSDIKIIMDGVTFSDNIAMYYSQYYTYNLANLQTLVQGSTANLQSFSSGFIKFLTTVESQDIPLATVIPNERRNKMGFVLRNANIANNKLLSSGCLFPTQWAEAYFVVDTQIIGNIINPNAEAFQVIAQDRPNMTTVEQNKHGLFCIYTADSLLQWPYVLFTMHKITAKNNNGILVNQAASNAAVNMISESHFENNTCLAAGMITAFTANFVLSINNTFINNFNALGNIFIHKDTGSSSFFHSYFNNSGIHASIMYIAQSLTSIKTEVYTRAYWNDIHPPILIFQGGNMAQGAPYFFDGAYAVLMKCDFRQNKAYSGLLNAIQGTVAFYNSNVSDHAIAGVSVVGTLMSMSNIFMTYCQVINNSISSRPDAFVTNLGILVLYTTRFGAAYSDFINGTVDNGGVLFFGNTANAIILFSSIQNYIKLDNVHNYLIWLTFTYTTIQGLTFSNTTNLFNLVNSNVTISGLAIQNLQVSFGTQFIAQSFESTIMMFGVAFNGDGQTESSTALFEGEKNYFVLIYSTFIDGTTNVINMKSNTFFSLTGTQFIFNQYPNQVTVVSLSFSANAVITSCLFQGAATVLEADNTQSQLTFVDNIILTNSVSQNILISTPKGVIFEQNYIINNGITTPLEVPQSQVQIMDSLDVVYLSQNHFQSLLASINPVIIQCQKYPYNISATDNTFIDNKASYGGAFGLSAQRGWTGSIVPQATIQNSVFLANKAAYDPINGPGSGRAGAIYLKSVGSTPQETLLEGSIFVGNHAEGVGGAIYFEYSPPIIDDKCIFMENYGDSLNHIAGYPTRLSLYDGSAPPVVYNPNQSRRSLSSITQNKWEGIGSGVTNQGPYSFALLDMYGQVVSDDNSSELQIWPAGYSSSNRSNFAPKLSAIANKGIYSFEDFVFNYRVNEQINVNFISSAIQNNPNNPYTNVSTSISVQVSFRECKTGEYTLKTEDSTKCLECQPGYWYLGGGGEFNNSCVECEQQSTFCLGGSNVGPRPGYWRLNNMATIVKQCPNQGACLGNEADSTGTLDPQGKCKEGFTGNLCNNCQEGWAKKSPTSNCVNCHTNVAQYLQLAGLILLQVAFLAYNVKKTMEIATQYFTNKGGLELKHNAAILLRILTNYMQIVALVGDIPVTWPTVIKDTMSVSSKASSANGQAFSIDCFYLILKASSGIRLVFLKVLMVTATPLIYIILGGLFWVIYFKIKKRIVIGNKDLLNKIITTIVIICFNLQPSVVKSCFELFQCTNLYRNDSPILFLTSDYDVQCWESEHFRWAIGLGLPCLLLWGIGLPLGMFAVLRRNYRKLDTPEIVKKYVFLYLGYKNYRFYWEFIIMLRKLSLICVSVFAGFHSIDLQIYMVVIIILWAHVLQRTGHPYNDDNLNHLELVALLSAGVVDFCGLYFQIIGDVEGLNTIMIIAGLAGNLYFILHFVWLYFTYQVEQIKQNEKAMKIINMIGDKLCCCLKTKSAKKALTKIKTIVNRSKTSLTRSLRSIVIDEELNPLNTITLADTKGPSSNELHISVNENVKGEDNQLRTAPKPQYFPESSRINVDEKDIVKEDIIRESNEEESIMDNQGNGEKKLETVNMQSIVLSMNKEEESNGEPRVGNANEKFAANLDYKIEEANGESRLESVDEKSIILTLDQILEGTGSG